MDRASIASAEQKERAQAAFDTAMKDPEHMKEWLEKSGRRWLVLDSRELIDALAKHSPRTWKEGCEALQSLLALYAQHRAGLETGRFTIEQDPKGDDVRIPIFKDETLEIEELDRCIRDLITEASKKDSSWSLDNPAR